MSSPTHILKPYWHYLYIFYNLVRYFLTGQGRQPGLKTAGARRAPLAVFVDLPVDQRKLSRNPPTSAIEKTGPSTQTSFSPRLQRPHLPMPQCMRASSVT